MVDIILKGLLFLSPIAYGTNIDLNLFDMIFFRTGCIALFMASLLDKPKRELSKKFTFTLLSLMALVFINLFIYTFAQAVMSQSLNFFLGCIALYIIIKYLDNPQKCVKWIVFAALINIAVYLLQLININPILNQSGYSDTFGGIIGNNARFGTYLGLVSLFNPILSIFAILISILSKYKQLSIVVAIVFPLFFIYRRDKRTLILLAILSFFGIIFYQKHIAYSLNFRWVKIWYPALFELFRRPLLGYGLGIVPIEGEFLMNSYLQITTGIGISVIAWFVYVAKNYWREILNQAKEHPAMLSLLILMSIEPVLETPRLWFTIIFIIASFIKEKEAVLCG